MSAGGISYSGVFPRRTVTLPSVEMWGTDMNILKEPHKSITTRRIDKVGSNLELLNMIEDAPDRIVDNILVYGRGLNIFKTYGDKSNRPKETYRLQTDGAFRPPIITPQQVMPLSRQPRALTQVKINPGYIKYLNQTQCAPPRCVKKETFKASVKPNKRVKMNTTLKEPYTVKYVIQNPIKRHNTTSGRAGKDVTTHKNENAYSYIDQNYKTHSVGTQLGSDGTVQHQHQNLDTRRYLQNTLHADRMTNASRPNGGKYIHKQVELERNQPLAEGFTNKLDTGKAFNHRHTNTIQRDRNTPLTSVQLNKSTARNNTTDNNSKTFKLAPKIQPGSFMRNGRIPTFNRWNNNGERKLVRQR